MPPAHIRQISPNDLAVYLQEIDALPIDAASKKVLKDIARAAANPDVSKLETIIKTLPKERQAQIFLIFEEIAARQQAQAEAAARNLAALLLVTLGGLVAAYLASPDQEALQAAQLLEIMKQTWINAIQDEIDYCGCNRRAQQPQGEQLEHLEEMARNDAKSIINTWNKDSQKQLAKLYEANPTGSKQYFIENMQAWANARALDKSLFVAFNTETRAREYARMRFFQENYAETTKFVFKGSPPVCEDCMARFAAGVVDFDYIQKWPCPRHPNCEHRWAALRKPKVDCAALWTG